MPTSTVYIDLTGWIGVNMVIKALTIFGTRPEAIKMAPLIKKLNQNDKIQHKVCVTGQHQQMLHSVLELFEIKPDFNLEVMSPNQSLSGLTAKILMGLNNVFEQYLPDLILVHGDTTTTLAASLSAYYHRIPTYHVEAGLRTGDIYSPWPEEINRKLTGSLACVHFAPTQKAKDNLLNEGISASQIYVTGNTAIDALYEMDSRINSNLKLDLKKKFSFIKNDRKLILVTGHRRENFGAGFEKICRALVEISKKFPDIDIVYPVHLNPNVQKPVNQILGNIKTIHLIEPLDYLSFVYLMKAAYLILTDSGGIQEEAPSLGIPVLVMRETTERPEAVVAGTSKIVGSDINTIVDSVEMLLINKAEYSKMSLAKNPYGDGLASERIVQHILNENFHILDEAISYEQSKISNTEEATNC